MTSDPIQDAIEYYRSGESEKARSLLKQLIQQNPEDEAAWYWYVEMLPTLTARIRTLETFLQIVPDNHKARKALESFTRQRSDLQAQAAGTPQLIETFPPPEPPPTPINIPSPARKPAFSTALPAKKNNRKGKSMILWLLPLILLAAVISFIVNPFEEKPSDPQKIYMEQMTPVLSDIEAWNEGPIFEWGIILQSKDSWGISTYQEDITDPVLRVIRRDELITALVPLANQISQDGEAILRTMEPITPPDEISEPHYSIILCLEYQIHKAEATSSFIQHDTISQLGEDYCQDFPDAFADIENYFTGD